MRVDGRKPDELRPVQITPNYTIYAEGSVLIEMGRTKVLCTATIEDRLPRWMQIEGKSGGWVTAEYAMLPRATHQRTNREEFKPRGRTQEIRRLIGRSLRTAVNLDKIGQRTCIIDCDVLQADGGTRTAAITGGYIALVTALRKLIIEEKVPKDVLLPPVAAISVGVLGGMPLLDLCYQEDSQAETDANIVMNSQGHFIEVQASAERKPISHQILNDLLTLADKGIQELIAVQNTVLERII